jgi:acyl-CoA synthetase (AMP-forming)/AMP-acid ligase II
VGCDIVLRDFLVARPAVEVCAAEGISVITGVPALWRRLVDVDWPAAAQASMRRWATTGGSMPPRLSEQICERLPASRPILMYGFTEAFRATYLPARDYDDGKSSSVGVPIPHAAIAVIGPEGRLCRPGEMGEVVQFGPLVSNGYWNRPEETAEKFAAVARGTRKELEEAECPYAVPAGYLERAAWSGDNGTVDESGLLYFHSRRSDLIKSQGFRVSPTEVEAACIATGLVDDVVAVGVEREDRDEVIAIVARPASAVLREADLLRALRESVPGYQVPSLIILREELPLGANGKYDRQALTLELREAAAAA